MSALYLVVPAPWKRIVLTLHELPEGWGLIEVSGSTAAIVLASAEREEVEEPTPGFVAAMLRAALQRPEVALPGSTAPMVAVTRPALSHSHAGLACGHKVPRLWKVPPRSAPCWACAEGQPVDLEIVQAVIDDATPVELARLERAIAGRKGGL